MADSKFTPRIIIHGGAGNITRTNLSKDAYQAYRSALLSILNSSYSLLSKPGATALDVATHAVALLEDNRLFNSGVGAVYTQAGTHELEASVMVSQGYRKRGAGVMMVNRVKNPIKLAREVLLRGESGDNAAGNHVQLAGETANELAERWQLELVSPSYYWTKRRWDEHRKGLGKNTDSKTYLKHKKRADGGSLDYGIVEDELPSSDFHDPSWNEKDYLPQGTVGCVVLDSSGTLCVATSTGGLTNKLPGRIGASSYSGSETQFANMQQDTPTFGAGFWAEQWIEENPFDRPSMLYQQPVLSPAARLVNGDFSSVLRDCLPTLSSYLPVSSQERDGGGAPVKLLSARHGVAMSGTGNGDSFLKLCAVRTTAAMSRFSFPPLPLALAVSRMAGPDGMLQQSAEDHWGKTGEGEGGIIGIEFHAGQGKVVADFNCGGMFRAWVDDDGKERMMVFGEDF